MDENDDVTVTVRFKCSPQNVKDLFGAWFTDEFVTISFWDGAHSTNEIITTSLDYVREQ